MVKITVSNTDNKPAYYYDFWRIMWHWSLSNDAENTDLIPEIYSIFSIYSHGKQHLNCNNISQYYWFYCIFDYINAALQNRRTFLKKVLSSISQINWINVIVLCSVYTLHHLFLFTSNNSFLSRSTEFFCVWMSQTSLSWTTRLTLSLISSTDNDRVLPRRCSRCHHVR